MSGFVVLVATIATLAVQVGGAHAAAIIIPDHTFRLGSCGGPQGPACTWNCGVGKGCTADSTCELHGTRAFGALLTARTDDTPCGGPPGSVLRLGLAGTSGGNPFQTTEVAFDLCARDITCTGRGTRSCGTCPSPSPCFSDDGDGNYPCAPGPVVFFCLDQCVGESPHYFDEGALGLLGALNDLRLPLPELLRSQLPSPPAAGRPIIYYEESFSTSSDDPPQGSACVRVMYTSQDKPLSVCSNDATILCSTAADCPNGGTCESGTPPGVNPTAPDTNASTSACTGGGGDDGRPCVANGDCDSGTCTSLPAATTGPCPQPACGDRILDPGEECDDGGGSGDGCDANCAVEPCFTCSASLGGGSFCFQSPAGTPCDLDRNFCTADTCDGFGTCDPADGATTCGSSCLLGDCRLDDGFNLLDVLSTIDIVLARTTPTSDGQRCRCDVTCDAQITLSDVLREIDGILGRVPTPLVCPVPAAPAFGP